MFEALAIIAFHVLRLLGQAYEWRDGVLDALHAWLFDAPQTPVAT